MKLQFFMILLFLVLEKEGFKDKSWNKLMDAIEKS